MFIVTADLIENAFSKQLNPHTARSYSDDRFCERMGPYHSARRKDRVFEGEVVEWEQDFATRSTNKRAEGSVVQ